MQHPGSFIRLLALLVLVLTCVGGRPVAAQDAELSRELWAEAETFRVIAASDFLFALDQTSTPQANQKLAELSGMLWPERASPQAWSGFFRYALVTFVAGGYDWETVLYQHPWADVVLLTAWARAPEDGRLRIVDVGIAMGSVVRGAKPPYPTGRGWIADGGYAPEAVARVNAATTRAIIGYEAGETESPLPSLGDEAMTAMIGGAGLQLQEHQAELLPLLIDEPGIARAVRFGWNEVMAAAQQGRLAEVLPPEAPVAALSALDRAFWGTLEPVGYFETAEAAVAIYASWRNPDLYVALRYSGSGEAGRISDFDLYSFSATLNEAAQ